MAYIPPNPNGQATSANSAPVVLASDQSAVSVTSGYKAIDLRTSASVSAGARTDAAASRNGIVFTLAGHPNTQSKNLQVTDTDGAQTNTAIVAGSANTAIVVTKLSVTADNANTANVSVRIGLGASSTPAADASGVLLFHPGIAPGSGVVEGTGAGILGVGASGEGVYVTCADPVGGSISIIVTYHTVAIG